MIFTSQANDLSLANRSAHRPLVGLVALLVAVLVVSGCSLNFEFGEDIEGTGPVVTQRFDLSDFEDVTIADSVDATIEVGPGTSVVVQAHENLFEYLDVDVSGNVFKIDAIDDTDLEGIINVSITMPTLRKLEVSGASSAKVLGSNNVDAMSVEVSGAGEVTVEEVNASKVAVDVSGASDLTFGSVTVVDFELDASGSSDITAAGTAQSVGLDVSGSSTADLGQLAIDKTSVSLDGSSDADVRQARQVEGELSGASTLHVDGDASIDVSASDASDVRTN